MVLEGERSYTQNKKTGQKTRIMYEEVKYVMHARVPSKEEEIREEPEKIFNGTRFAVLPRGRK